MFGLRSSLKSYLLFVLDLEGPTQNVDASSGDGFPRRIQFWWRQLLKIVLRSSIKRYLLFVLDLEFPI